MGKGGRKRADFLSGPRTAVTQHATAVAGLDSLRGACDVQKAYSYVAARREDLDQVADNLFI